MAYQKINALTRRDLLHNQPEYTSTLKKFRLAIKKIFLKNLLAGYEELGGGNLTTERRGCLP